MDEKTNTDLMNVLASIKSLVTDEGETPKEAAVSGIGGKLILAPSLRLADDASDDESQKKEMLEEKIAQLEEMLTNTVGPCEPDAAGQDGYAGSTVTKALLEEIADATVSDLSGYVSDVPDEDPLIPTDGEALDRGEDDIVEALVPPLPVDYEALKTMVTDIIRVELQGVLGEKITANIRNMVRREINVAVTKISRDLPD